MSYGRTLRREILSVLEAAPDGCTLAEVREGLKARSYAYHEPTLSPTMTDLHNGGLIWRKNGTWRLVGRKAA